jgi:outer membrane protein OmpA-like peptidoglycan-associated protein
VKTLENALDLQNALLSMGYSNAFVTAYQGSKRISLIESVLDGLSVYFNLDSYKVLPTEMEKIDFYFKKYTNKTIKEVELEGNTCNLGTAEYNFKLSERRVLAVEQALTPYVKVKVNRKFLGEFYPLYDNSTERSRKLNRRVDVIILN